jgi:hypothetical protein
MRLERSPLIPLRAGGCKQQVDRPGIRFFDGHKRPQHEGVRLPHEQPRPAGCARAGRPAHLHPVRLALHRLALLDGCLVPRARLRPGEGVLRSGNTASSWKGVAVDVWQALREHPFVTSQGSPYGRFQRAIQRGDLLEAETNARELGRLSLRDALSLVVLFAAKDPPRFERAALRWHARFEQEVPGVGLTESSLALAALVALRTSRHDAALRTLLALAEPRLR